LFRAMQELAYGKCAYCECVLELTSYLEIEHYIAKTVAPARAFEWENLLPVCRLCNGKKGAIDHAGLLLKPDTDDVENMVWLNPDSGEFEVSAATDAATTIRVERTIELCDLKRPTLCSKRIEMMNRVHRWLQRLQDRGGVPDKLLREEWEEFIDPRTEHKFVI